MGNVKSVRVDSEEATRELLRLTWRLSSNVYREVPDNTIGPQPRNVVEKPEETKCSKNSNTSIVDSEVQKNPDVSLKSSEMESKTGIQGTSAIGRHDLSLRIKSFSHARSTVEDSDLRNFNKEFEKQFLTYCPDLKHRYPVGYLIISKMIISFIASIVDGDKTDQMIERFARAHVRYCLKKQHFEGFGMAIVMTVQARLGKLATIPVTKIWAEVMMRMVRKMWKAYKCEKKRTSKRSPKRTLNVSDHMNSGP
mmetsp:Transcript_10989/g.15287  ORF Transcript_10989/g.15287 Transcript_10989/m.15287 type:complete len:252 (+) Transcript_10989:162-917(+)|eukprot:CAMPEP_0184487710 /NCGR_PEP_ID=MMETSP0113_2-20130426/10285_1 /TAXON_ID=91329 /ORGANISM="Norrisiella sphaerica, Strain BC52" /LENGTH=251 /DNA_ID=CAMNT_0026870095 /DNA_START=145 /DNA_END=900 /DNA_ORIENTATION=+